VPDDPPPEHRWPTERELALVGGNLRSALEGFGQLIRTGFAWVDENREAIGAFWKRTRDDDRHGDWDYLLHRVSAFDAIPIRLALEARRSFTSASPGQRDELLAATVSDGLTEPGTIEAVLAGLEHAPLSEVKQQQLAHGLQHLAAGEYHLAVPALIGPLEGTFWHTAQERGLIRLDDHGDWRTTAKTSKPGVKVGAIEKLSTYLLQGEPEFAGFLRGVAYGGEGHPYRHGFAEDRWQVRALCLLVALIGWLEFVGAINADEVIRDGFLRANEATEAERHPPATATGK
jgi:hypothetical protein